MVNFFVSIKNKTNGKVEEFFERANNVRQAIGMALDECRIREENYYEIGAKQFDDNKAWVVKGRLCDGYFHRVFYTKERALEWMADWCGYPVENIIGDGNVAFTQYGNLILRYEEFATCPYCGCTVRVGGYDEFGRCLDCVIEIEEE